MGGGEYAQRSPSTGGGEYAQGSPRLRSSRGALTDPEGRGRECWVLGALGGIPRPRPGNGVAWDGFMLYGDGGLLGSGIGSEGGPARTGNKE